MKFPIAVCLSLACLVSNAAADPWKPTRSVRVIVPFQAGGPIDTVARVVAQNLSEAWGQPFVVENRTGGGGNIGADAVAKAEPDGYTLGMAAGGTHGSNPALFGDKMPFDPVKDFAPITMLAQMKNILLVHPSVGAKNLQELIAKGKERGELAFGSAGIGTIQHLTGEMFKVQTHLNLTHITYRGQAQALPDLLSGRISMMFVGAGDSVDHVRSGALIPIGGSALTRSPLLPDVPSLSEQGLQGFDATTWFGLVAPAGTPPDIVAAYQQKIAEILKRDEISGKLQKLGIDTVTSTPQEFGKFIRSEVDKWGGVVRSVGIKLN